MQILSEIILVISNRTSAQHKCNFEILHMISDQIALSSIIIEIKETNYISKFERQDSGELFYLVYVENI